MLTSKSELVVGHDEVFLWYWFQSGEEKFLEEFRYY
jgi:hypothetical protein